MSELLSLPVRPTAVLTANNYLTYGAIDVLRAANLTVPKDISLVCFDTPDNTGLIIPALCTANQPAKRIGAVSVEVLFRKFSGSSVGMNERIYLDAEILWGASVAPPPEDRAE